MIRTNLLSSRREVSLLASIASCCLKTAFTKNKNKTQQSLGPVSRRLLQSQADLTIYIVADS